MLKPVEPNLARKRVPKIKPRAGAEFSVIPESELPKPVVVVTFVPSIEAGSVDEAVQLLRHKMRDFAPTRY